MTLSIGWYKNKWLNIGNINISAKDRGLKFGDGIFETILIKNNNAILIDEHIKRLENSSKILNMDWNINKSYLKKIINLGPKAIIMFLTGTLGILIGGPLSLLLVSHFFPNLIPISSDELWRGLTTVAGSWIGGGANQAAMKEMFNVNDQIFSSMITVDVIVANIFNCIA